MHSCSSASHVAVQDKLKIHARAARMSSPVGLQSARQAFPHAPDVSEPVNVGPLLLSGRPPPNCEEAPQFKAWTCRCRSRGGWLGAESARQAFRHAPDIFKPVKMGPLLLIGCPSPKPQAFSSVRCIGPADDGHACGWPGAESARQAFPSAPDISKPVKGWDRCAPDNWLALPQAETAMHGPADAGHARGWPGAEPMRAASAGHLRRQGHPRVLRRGAPGHRARPRKSASVRGCGGAGPSSELTCRQTCCWFASIRLSSPVK